VFGAAFAKVEDAELREDASYERVPFGGADAPWDAVKLFYDCFLDFQSVRSFASYDKWKVDSDAPRHVRRVADADNKSRRKRAKAEFQATVRELAARCRARDPRVEQHAAEVRDAKAAKAAEAARDKEAQRAAHLEAKRRWREQASDDAFDAYEVRTGTLLGDVDDDDASSSRDLRAGRRRKSKSSAGSSKKSQKNATPGENDDEENTLADDNNGQSDDDAETPTVPPRTDDDEGPTKMTGEDHPDEDVDSSCRREGEEEAPADDDDDRVVVYACDVCKKTFKSDKQLQNHLQSKAHKKKAALVR